jgi:beta-phosphoglucomutase-like phosphatase (HAD superfamily)
MDLGDPRDFYDAIVTAGFPIRPGQPGTLGELSPKPHPWLYVEASRVGLGIEFTDRNAVVGIEDSGAGVCAIRLAGFPTIGMAGGNILESGTRALCNYYCESLAEAFQVIKGLPLHCIQGKL